MVFNFCTSNGNAFDAQDLTGWSESQGVVLGLGAATMGLHCDFGEDECPDMAADVEGNCSPDLC